MRRFLVLAVLPMLLAGCAARKTYPISDVKYAPNPRPENVRLFVGELNTAHQEIAWVDSFAAQSRSGNSRTEQLRDLRLRAAKLGADAVVDIKVMKERHRGAVPDPMSPMHTWEQGDFELYFLRGKAIRFAAGAGDPVLEWEEQQAGMTLEEQPLGPSLIPSGGQGRIPEATAPVETPTPVMQPRPGY